MADRLDTSERLQDLDALLNGIAHHIADASEPPRSGVPATSGRLYAAVTEYWPRVALGLVVVVAVADLVIGRLTADTPLEFYVLAWATTTSGLWFLFEKAEKAVSGEARTRVSQWLLNLEPAASIRTWPESFARVFDQIFGSRHFSVRCFYRSSLASLAAVAVITLLIMALLPSLAIIQPGDGFILRPYLGQIGLLVMINLLADYLSLLETRHVIRWMKARSTWLVVVGVLIFDLVATTLIWSTFAVGSFDFLLQFLATSEGWDWISPAVMAGALAQRIFLVLFLSTFFTSVWLWLYAGSVLLSRLLLRMNDGVGFLLRVTDVERQPFRSMGFVSVIIVSVIFALGLPLVLL